jgi:dephospho-CoA kinase
LFANAVSFVIEIKEEKMIIGIVGSIASGKDTVGEYLAKKGFVMISLSDVLRSIMRSEKIETTVPNMTKYGNDLRKKKGHGYLAKLAYKQAAGKDAVLTSIRQVGEIEYLRQFDDFTLIKLDAPIEMRLKRLIDRSRDGDVRNLAELREIERKQADGKNGGMNMNECFKLADLEIINDGTFEDLYKEVDSVIERLRQKKT